MDKFTDYTYNDSESTDEVFTSPEKLKEYIDSLKLIGRTIESMRALGIAYNLISLGDSFDDCMETIETKKEEYYACPDKCEDIYGPRWIEGDEPLLIRFDDGRILSLYTFFLSTYKVGIDSIPFDILCERDYHIDANIFFSPVIGRKIVDVIVNIYGKENEYIDSIDLCMDDKLKIRVKVSADFIEVSIMNENNKTLMISGKELEKAVPVESRSDQFKWDLEDLREQYRYLISKYED